MAQIVMVDKKYCATCQYWDGERKLVFQNRRPHHVAFETNERAKCPAASNQLKSGTHGVNCPAYKRWNEL